MPDTKNLDIKIRYLSYGKKKEVIAIEDQLVWTSGISGGDGTGKLHHCRFPMNPGPMTAPWLTAEFG